MYFSMKRSNASFLTNKLDIFCSYQTHFLTKIAKIAMLSAARQRHLGRHATLLSVIYVRGGELCGKPNDGCMGDFNETTGNYPYATWDWFCTT